MALSTFAKEHLRKRPSDMSLTYLHAPEVDQALDRLQEAGRADINLGHACPHRCLFCMQGYGSVEQKQWVPLDKLKKELDFYRNEKGYERLGLLGGEPTLYPWIIEALAYAKSIGFKYITINSNAYKFAEMDFARAAVDAGLTRFCLSIHGHTVAIEDTLSGSEGSLKRKVQAIINLKKLKAEGKLIEGISLNPVLTRLNMTDLPGFIDLYFHRLKVNDLRFNFCRPEGRAAESREIVASFAEAMPYIVALILRNEREWGHDITFGEIPWCAWPAEIWNSDYLRHKYIGEFRDIRTLVSTWHAAKAPDGADGKKRFVWQELKKHVLKAKAEACTRCPAVEYCGGVWRNYLDLYGHGEFHPLDLPTVTPPASNQFTADGTVDTGLSAATSVSSSVRDLVTSPVDSPPPLAA